MNRQTVVILALGVGVVVFGAAVLFGIGFFATFLTSQVSVETATVESEEVIVASRDLPVGTLIGKEDLPKFTKLKMVPKDALPLLYVRSTDELIDKRLARPIHADDTFDPRDFCVSGVKVLPKGMDIMSLQVGLPEADNGVVIPGSRVDILATMKSGERQISFPLLVDVLLVAVDFPLAMPKKAAPFKTLPTISLAVDRRQALLIQLACSRGCNMHERGAPHGFDKAQRVRGLDTGKAIAAPVVRPER